MSNEERQPIGAPATDGTYYDSDGRTCSLPVLCRREPEWAASRIRAERDRLARLTAAARELLLVLPRCEHAGCPKPATRGHISHEPHWCEEHRDEGYSFRRCDWAEEVEALQAILEEP